MIIPPGNPGQMPFAQPNGVPKPGVHPGGYAIPRIPLSPFPAGPHSQPYAIPPSRGIHGPVGNRGFGTGRGTAGQSLSHPPDGLQHGGLGNIGAAFNFPMDNPNSQPSVGGLMTQV